MDAQSLFGKEKVKIPKKEKKLIAAGTDIDDKPLIFGLEKEDNFFLKYGSSKQRFDWISQGMVDMGFISSIDFAFLTGGWKVLPNICKSTKGSSKRVVLFFNKNLNEIDSIAIPDNARTSDIVLKLILKELYQIESKFVRMSAPLSTSLKKCDAVLLTGDLALKETENNPFFIDIGEEWFDLTGLPLVYGFWIGNELTTEKSDFKKLADSCALGQNNIGAIVKKSTYHEKHMSDYLSLTVNYNLGEEEQAGLDELYRFAFFYGLVDYIPDFNFMDI